MQEEKARLLHAVNTYFVLTNIAVTGCDVSSKMFTLMFLKLEIET